MITSSADSYPALSRHVGHEIRCVHYGLTPDEPWNVSLECETCCEVLVDFDTPQETPERGEA